MATDVSILAWETLETEEPLGYTPRGHKSWSNLATKPLTSFLLSFHYYHLIVKIDTYIFKCNVHFIFRQ